MFHVYTIFSMLNGWCRREFIFTARAFVPLQTIRVVLCRRFRLKPLIALLLLYKNERQFK